MGAGTGTSESVWEGYGNLKLPPASFAAEMHSAKPFDQEAFLRDARNAAVESGDLNTQFNHGRLQKVRILLLSLSC